MAKKIFTYEEIGRDLKERKFYPVYFLMGEEPYFIDRITDFLLQNVLKADELDFNRSIFYGADTKVTDILNAVRRFPMMSDYQLVVVREAQMINLDKLELLTNYVKNPLKSTILVINYKYKTLDRRKAFAIALEKNGVLFESQKIKDYKLADYIAQIMQRRSIATEEKAAQMLADFLGNDLELINKELDKLLIVLANQPVKKITPELIERNVGISKDFNNFELKSAIATKDILKANRIAQYYEKDPKNHSLSSTLPILFNYFSNLLICHYSKDKSERGLMNLLSFQYAIQVVDYQNGLRNFTAKKVFDAIHEIRLADARSKGVDSTSSVEEGDIMKELLYKILH